MRFARRPDGSRPSQNDEDSALFEILGTQECHTLHSMRKLRQTWSVALNTTGLSDIKIKRLWHQMLDAQRPMWWADEISPDNVSMDWTTANNAQYAEYYELTEMLYFVWSALRTHVCPLPHPTHPARTGPDRECMHMCTSHVRVHVQNTA